MKIYRFFGLLVACVPGLCACGEDAGDSPLCAAPSETVSAPVGVHGLTDGDTIPQNFEGPASVKGSTPTRYELVLGDGTTLVVTSGAVPAGGEETALSTPLPSVRDGDSLWLTLATAQQHAFAGISTVLILRSAQNGPLLLADVLISSDAPSIKAAAELPIQFGRREQCVERIGEEGCYKNVVRQHYSVDLQTDDGLIPILASETAAVNVQGQEYLFTLRENYTVSGDVISGCMDGQIEGRTHWTAVAH